MIRGTPVTLHVEEVLCNEYKIHRNDAQEILKLHIPKADYEEYCNVEDNEENIDNLKFMSLNIDVTNLIFKMKYGGIKTSTE